MPSTPGGFAHRVIGLEVDLGTGALTETSGHLVEATPLTMAPEVHARIVEACRGALAPVISRSCT